MRERPIFSVEGVFEAIQKEIKRAEKKFPWWYTDPVHAAATVAEEAGELVKAALRFSYEKGLVSDMYDEALHTGAMVVRFLQHIQHYEETRSKRAKVKKKED